MALSSNLGAMVVRLALEMSGFKGGMEEAVRTTERGAGQINQAAQGMERGVEQITTALTRQTAVFGVVATAAAVVAKAYREGSSEGQAYVRMLAMTNNALGTTPERLASVARQMGQLDTTQARAASTIVQLAAGGKVAEASLASFGMTALRAERILGQAADTTVKAFDELGRAPTAASLKLNDSMNYLTESTYRQIKAAEDLGDKQGAAAIAQKAYQEALDRATSKVEANLGILTKAWNAVGQVAAKAWDAMLNVGRDVGPDRQLQQAIAALEKLQALKDRGGTKAAPGGELDRQIENAKQQIDIQRQAIRLAERAAQIQGDQVALERARVEWMRDGEKYLTREEKLKREILRIRREGAEAGKTEKEIEDRVIQAREAAADRRRKGVDEELKEARRVAEERQKLRLQEEKDIAKFFQDQDAERRKADQKQRDLEAKHQLEFAHGINEQIQKSQEAVAAAQQEYDAYGLLKSQVAELTLRKLEQQRVTMMMTGAWGEELKGIDAQIAAQRKLIDIYRQGEYREAVVKANEDAARNLQRIQEQFYEGLMSAAMRGGKSLWEYVKGLFRSAALRIVLQPVIAPLAGLVAGLTGGGAGGATGLLSGASSLASMGNSLGFLGGSSSALSNATGFGLGNLFGGGAGGSFASTVGAGVATDAMGATVAAGSSGATLGGGLAAIPGWGWAVAGLALLAGLSKAFKGETRAGGQYGYAIDGTGYSARRDKTFTDMANGAFFLEGPSGGDPNQANALAGVNTTVAGINSRFAAMGSSARVAGFNAGYETSDKGRGGVFAGGQLTGGIAFGESGKGDNYAGTLFETTSTQSPDAKAAWENYTTDLLQVSIQAIQADTGKARSIGKLVDGVNAESLTSDQAVALLSQVDAVIAGVEGFRQVVALLPPEFDRLKNLSFDAAAAIVEFSGGLEQFKANTSAYLTNFFSESERYDMAVANVAKRFDALGLRMIDLAQGSEAARAQFRALVEAQDPATEQGQKMIAALMGMAAAFAEVTPMIDAAADAAADASQALDERVEKAYARMRRTLDAAMQVQEEAVDELASLFDSLGDQVDELRGTVPALASMRASEANRFIDDAFGALQQGYRPDLNQLGDAISVARGQLDPSRYSSQFEFERDTLVLANKLESMQDLAGSQLSSAERQLDYLKDLNDAAERQYNKLKGIDDSTGSIDEVLTDWYAAVQAKEKAAKSPQGGTPSAGGPVAVFGPGGSGSTPAAADSKYKREFFYGTAGSGNVAVTDQAEIARLDALAAINKSYDGTGDLAGLLNEAREAGYTLSDLQAVTGFRYEDWLAATKLAGVPAFAGGGDHAGGARVVGEVGTEVEFTGPSRIIKAQQATAMFGGAADLAEQMRQYNLDRRAEASAVVDQLLQIKRLLKVLEKWDSAGLPKERSGVPA